VARRASETKDEMTCTACGATIADKAIVCYRCGAPTAVPARRGGPPPASRRPIVPAAAALAGAGALEVVGFTHATGTAAATPEMAAGAVLAAVGAWLLLRRRR
jgi:LPXTG-motif cell wall-anchored protein